MTFRTGARSTRPESLPVRLLIAAAVLALFAVFCGAADAAKKKPRRPAAAKSARPAAEEGQNTSGQDLAAYKKGISYYENAEYDKASEYFLQVYRTYPGSFYYDMSVFFLGEIAKKERRFDDALTYFAALIKNCPKSSLAPEALHNIAEIYRSRGVSSDAAKYYKYLVEIYPDSFWAEEARSYLNRQSPDQAIAADTASGPQPLAARRKPGNGISVDGLDRVEFEKMDVKTFVAGSKNYEPVDYGDEDLKLYRDALKAHEAGNYGWARNLYQKFIIKYKNSLWYPNAFYMLGSCYLATGDVKAAIRFYSAALLYCRDRSLQKEIKAGLSDLLFIDGQYLLALRYYEMLAAEETDPARIGAVYFMMGECNTKLRNFEDAVKNYAAVIYGSSSGDGRKIAASADYFISIPAPRKARPSVELSQPARPASGADAGSSSGGDPTDGSGEKKEEAARPWPKNPELSRLMAAANASFSARDYLKAVSSFEKAMVMDPENEDAMWRLALCYNQLEKPALATEYLQKFISKNPDSKDARSFLAYIYLKQNKYDLARDEYLRIISLEPESGSGRSAHEALKRIELMRRRSGEQERDERETDARAVRGNPNDNIDQRYDRQVEKNIEKMKKEAVSD